ncbi:MAG: HNH endonuclease [Gammaproteobacteria bacterium]|nr:HNH endonuclease [Gammaproteobacteria bacterium]
MKHWKSPWLNSPATNARSGRQVVYTSAWDRLARQTVQNNPLCQRCHKAPSTSAHHIKAVRLAPELMLDPRNAMAVCRPCHELLDHPKDRRKPTNRRPR